MLTKRFGYLAFLLLLACGQQEETQNHCKHCPLSKTAIGHSEHHSHDSVKENHLLMVADTITYDVTIINPDPNDEWTEECLRHVNHKALANYIFSRLKTGDLIAKDFFSGAELSNRKVKKIIEETRANEEEVGKLQFIEEWQIDTTKHIFQKKVKSIIMGKEIRSSDDKHVGYKPLFLVELP